MRQLRLLSNLDLAGSGAVIVAHVLVPPALEALLSCPGGRLQGLLAPGHVCTVTGYARLRAAGREIRIPIVVTGSSRWTSSAASWPPCASSRPARARVENGYRGRSAARATPRPGDDRGGVRRGRPEMARPRRDPAERLALAPEYAPSSRAASSTSRGSRPANRQSAAAGLVLQGRLRPPSARSSAIAVRPSIRSARHGLLRRGVRGVLPLPPSRGPPAGSRGG